MMPVALLGNLDHNLMVTCLTLGESIWGMGGWGGGVERRGWGGGGFGGAKPVGEGRVSRLFCIQELARRSLWFVYELHLYLFFFYVGRTVRNKKQKVNDHLELLFFEVHTDSILSFPEKKKKKEKNQPTVLQKSYDPSCCFNLTSGL